MNDESAQEQRQGEGNDSGEKEAPSGNGTAVLQNAFCANCVELEKKLNSPELHDFAQGVILEAAHQSERWGSEHDAGKEPQDWFWVVGYLAGKALAAHISGNTEKALHHTISAAAVLNNWHAAISGASTVMRPGISEEKQADADSFGRANATGALPVPKTSPPAPTLSAQVGHDFGRPGEGESKCRRCGLGYVDAHIPCRESAQVEGQTKALAGKEAVSATTHVRQNASPLDPLSGLRVKVAELCGWEQVVQSSMDCWEGLPPVGHEYGRDSGLWQIPDYPRDLNAMHEAEECTALRAQGLFVYVANLIGILKRNNTALNTAVLDCGDWVQCCIFSTAQERAEAFVNTLRGYSVVNGNDAGAPTGASAESGSLVSVEGQTDEGLWTLSASRKAAHKWVICSQGGNNLIANELNYGTARDITDAHNAALTKRQKLSQTDEEIADATLEQLYTTRMSKRVVDVRAEYTRVMKPIILAALRAKSEKEPHEGAYEVMRQSFTEEQAQHDETRGLLEEARASALFWKGKAHQFESEKQQSSGKKEAQSDDVNAVLQNALERAEEALRFSLGYLIMPADVEARMACEKVRFTIPLVEKALRRLLSEHRGNSPATSVPAKPIPVPSESEKDTEK